MANSPLAYSDRCPDLLPGLPDPLPDPPLRPVPLDWPCRRDVRDKHVAALQHLLHCEIPPPEEARGYGVVTCGGGIYWPGLVVSARMLRRVSDLPMQIWYRGGDEKVCPEDLAGVEGVELIDANKFFDPPPRILGGWQLKTLALLNCGWEKAVFLDADAYLLRSPEDLLSTTDQHRILYWQDLDNHWVNITWDWWGLDGTQGGKPPPIQGGQLFIDLLKFRRELVVWNWCNQHSDYAYWFPTNKQAEWHGYGDQDMCRVALNATRGVHYSLGRSVVIDEGLQCDFLGEAVVIHRTKRKLCCNGEINVTGKLPGDEHVRKILEEYMAMRDRPELIFWGAYKGGTWGVPGTCGAGSSPSEAAPYLDAINRLLAAQGWDTVVDLGCGDGSVNQGIQCKRLIGVDVCQGHIDALRKKRFAGEWHCLDIDRDREQLPSGDVALCKDVLHHWPTYRIQSFLRWTAQCGKWRAVIFAQDCVQDASEQDCGLGGYRALDPMMRPLRDHNLFCLGRFLHKAIVLQTCLPSRAVA